MPTVQDLPRPSVSKTHVRTSPHGESSGRDLIRRMREVTVLLAETHGQSKCGKRDGDLHDARGLELDQAVRRLGRNDCGRTRQLREGRGRVTAWPTTR